MQNISLAIDHLKKHQKYPATNEELAKECQELSDFSEADKKEFVSKLPIGTYSSADEVMQAVGL